MIPIAISVLHRKRSITRYIKIFQSSLTLEDFVIYNFVVPSLPMANKPLERPFCRISPHSEDSLVGNLYIFRYPSDVV